MGEFGGGVSAWGDALDEPVEDIADGGLAGLDAVHAREDALGDDAADAGNVGEGLVERPDHAIAGAGADDFDECAGLDSGTDGAHVCVEGADGDGDARWETDALGPVC